VAPTRTIDLTTTVPPPASCSTGPNALNAWNEQFGVDLLDAVTTVAGDNEIRAVHDLGAGAAFSSGADLKEQRGSDDGGLPDLSARLKRSTTDYHPAAGDAETGVSGVNGPAVRDRCSLAPPPT